MPVVQAQSFARAQPKANTVDKIIQALQIAKGVTGVATDVQTLLGGGGDGLNPLQDAQRRKAEGDITAQQRAADAAPGIAEQAKLQTQFKTSMARIDLANKNLSAPNPDDIAFVQSFGGVQNAQPTAQQAVQTGPTAPRQEALQVGLTSQPQQDRGVLPGRSGVFEQGLPTSTRLEIEKRQAAIKSQKIANKQKQESALQEKIDARKKEELGRAQTIKTSEIVSEDIDRAIEIAEGSIINARTGLLGSIVKLVPGTEAGDLDKLLDSIKANTAFETLSQMRKASKTGGALGQVSERELRLLQAALGSLDQSLSKKRFVKNLRRLKETVLDTIHGKGNRPSKKKTLPAPPPNKGNILEAGQGLSKEEQSELQALEAEKKAGGF